MGRWSQRHDRNAVVLIDVQRLHATAFGYSNSFHINPPGSKPADYAPEALPRMME